MGEDEFLSLPTVTAFLLHIREREAVRKFLLDSIIERAKQDNGSLWQAITSITDQLPKGKRSEAHRVMNEVVETYRREIADRAMWPNGNWPK